MTTDRDSVVAGSVAGNSHGGALFGITVLGDILLPALATNGDTLTQITT